MKFLRDFFGGCMENRRWEVRMEIERVARRTCLEFRWV